MSSSKYYVNAKINELRTKSYAYGQLAGRINSFAENARRIDKQVANLIAYEKARFQKSTGLGAHGPVAIFIEWLVGLKNKCPILEFIGNGNAYLMTFVKNIKDEIRHWYEFEGGKEILGIVGAVVAAVIAVALFIVTLPASGFLAICAAIGAAISVINAIYNIYSSAKSYEAARNGDPAWAKIYADEDKLSDGLRRHNFGSKELNGLSMVGATVLDGTELFCNAVGIVGTIKSIIKSPFKFNFLNNYFDENLGLRSYMKTPKWTFNKDLNKYVMVTDKAGNVKTTYTFKSIARGMKAYIKDAAIDAKTDVGIRTKLNESLKLDFNDWKNSYSLTGIKDTIRYNISHSGYKEVFQKGTSWENRMQGIKNLKNTVSSVREGVGSVIDISQDIYNVASGNEPEKSMKNISNTIKDIALKDTLYSKLEGLEEKCSKTVSKGKVIVGKSFYYNNAYV